MDKARVARRSMSHGALSTTLNSREAANCARSASQGLGQGLDTVKENSNLFACPGPLESMLKKTTETGDIGFFSIKPGSAPSPLPIQRPLRSRTNFRDTTLQNLRDASITDVQPFQDDRRGLPSFREAGSEIVSTYGSESQSSAASSLIPPYDSNGQRSYSMTGYGSKLFPRQRSNGTLQSQSSGGHLQRPRSPFPYPTRLKRPGVRPSSPALTTDGTIDYSRMVEINRVSYRTVHGAYQPAFPPAPGHQNDVARRTPRILRPEPIPPLGPPRLQAHQSLGRRDRYDFDGVMDKWRPGTSHFNQDRRAATFTSTTQLYRRRPSPLDTRKPTNPPQRSFYYDYTEEFDTKRERTPMPITALAPVPTRAASISRHVVLDQDCLTGSDGQESASMLEGRSLCLRVLELPPALPALTVFQSPPEEVADEAHQNTLGEGTSENVEAEDQKSGLFRNGIAESFQAQSKRVQTTGSRGSIAIRRFTVEEIPSACTDPEPEVSAVASADLRPRGDTSTFQNNSQRPAAEESTTGPPAPSIVSAEVASVEVLSDQHTSLNSSSGAASLLSQLPAHHDSRCSTLSSRLKESKFPSESDDRSLRESFEDHASADINVLKIVNADGTVGLARGANAFPDAESVRHDEIQIPITQTVHSKSQAHVPVSQYRLRHRHDTCYGIQVSNLALPPMSDRSICNTRLKCEPIPIHAPKPVSPAKELRLRNSIPQLMKALPPLPRSGDYGDPHSRESSTHDCCSEPLSPFSPSSIFASRPTQAAAGSPGSSPGRTHDICEEDAQEIGHACTVSPKPATGSDSRSDLTGKGKCQEPKTPQRIQEFCGLLGIPADKGLQTRHQGKAKRRPKYSQSALAAFFSDKSRISSKIEREINREPQELAGLPPATLLFARSEPASKSRQLGTRFNSGDGGESNEFGQTGDVYRLDASCRSSLDMQRGSSLDAGLDKVFERDPSTHPCLARDIQGVSAGGIREQPARGLRKRISNFRIRLAESRSRYFEERPTSSRLLEEAEPMANSGASENLSAPAGANGGPLVPRDMNGCDGKSVVGRRGIRRRLSGWVKSAKLAVGAYGRRRGRI